MMHGSRREQEVHAVFVDQMVSAVEEVGKPILDVTAPSEQMDTTDAFLSQANTLKAAERLKNVFSVLCNEFILYHINQAYKYIQLIHIYAQGHAFLTYTIQLTMLRDFGTSK